MDFALHSIENIELKMEKSSNSTFILRKNMKIFIDNKSCRGKLEQIDNHLKKLKIIKEEFLTKDVNYIVCHKLFSTMDLSFTASQGKLGLSILSRGHTLLQRSNLSSTVNNLTDPHTFAENWKIPIISPDEFYRLIKSTLLLKEKNSKINKNRYLIRYFNNSYIKFEDSQMKLTPNFKCFNVFPEISFLQHYNSLFFFNNNLSCSYYFKSKEGLKFFKNKTHNNKKTLTNEFEKMNFCECCDILFDGDVITHIASSQHKQFIEIDDNFLILDKVINNLSKINDFFLPKSYLININDKYLQNYSKASSSDLQSLIFNYTASNKMSFPTFIPNTFNHFIPPTNIIQELYNPIDYINNLTKNIFENWFNFNVENITLKSSNLLSMSGINMNKEYLTYEIDENLFGIHKNFSAYEFNYEKNDNFHPENSNTSDIDIFQSNLDLKDKSFKVRISKFNKSPALISDSLKDANKTINFKNKLKNHITKDISIKNSNINSSFVPVSHIFNNLSIFLNASNPDIFLKLNEPIFQYDKKDKSKVGFSHQCQCLSSIMPSSYSTMGNELINCTSENVNSYNFLTQTYDIPLNFIISISQNTLEEQSLNKNLRDGIHLKEKIENSCLEAGGCNSYLNIEDLTNITNNRLRKMNETIQTLWTSTYLTDLKIKLSKLPK